MSKYREIYDYIKNEIVTGQVGYGGRLPSVRKASALFSVSRTTVQSAYFALSEDGYIISEPQSGYYVSYKSPAAQGEIGKKEAENSAETKLDRVAKEKRKLSAAEKEKLISDLTAEMKEAAKKLEFERAAYLRDKIKGLQGT